MESIRGYLDDLDYIYDMGILGGIKSWRRLYRTSLSVFQFFFVCKCVCRLFPLGIKFCLKRKATMYQVY